MNILKVLMLTWSVRCNIRRCSKFRKSTDERRLAEHYKEAMSGLKDRKDMTKLIKETEKLQKEFHDKKELSKLLKAVVAFLTYMKSVKSR